MYFQIYTIFTSYLAIHRFCSCCPLLGSVHVLIGVLLADHVIAGGQPLDDGLDGGDPRGEGHAAFPTPGRRGWPPAPPAWGWPYGRSRSAPGARPPRAVRRSTSGRSGVMMAPVTVSGVTPA